MRRLSPVARAFVAAGIFAVVILIAQFIRTVLIEGGEFRPDWIIVGAGAAALLVVNLIKMKL